MAETLGSAIDKLATINNKLFLQQELIYEIKRMSFDLFCLAFDAAPTVKSKMLYDGLQKLSDLNIQRTALVNEVDAKIIQLIKDGVAGKELDDGANLQRAHKTGGDSRESGGV
jgi:hypothetical protein